MDAGLINDWRHFRQNFKDESLYDYTFVFYGLIHCKQTICSCCVEEGLKLEIVTIN